MGMDLQAFWYKAGKIIKVDQNHISAIIANPESFGMIRDDIEETYKQFNEPIGCEGKAREQIMIEAMKNGWIRNAASPMIIEILKRMQGFNPDVLGFRQFKRANAGVQHMSAAGKLWLPYLFECQMINSF
jgi:hypothetical protein